MCAEGADPDYGNEPSVFLLVTVDVSILFKDGYHTAGYAGENMAGSQGLFVTLSVGTPLCPYGVAYRRVYGVSTSGLFKKSCVVRWVVCVCGLEKEEEEKKTRLADTMRVSGTKHALLSPEGFSRPDLADVYHGFPDFRQPPHNRRFAVEGLVVRYSQPEVRRGARPWARQQRQ